MFLPLPVWIFSAHFKIATVLSIVSVGTANAVIFGMVDEEKEVTQPALKLGGGLLDETKDFVGDVFIPTSKTLLRNLTTNLKNSFEVDGFFNQMSESTKDLLKGIKDFPENLEITKEFLKETFNSEAINEDFENVGNFVSYVGDLAIDVVDEKIPVYFDKTVDWIDKNVNTEEIINETGSLIASVIGQKPKVLIEDVEKNIKSMWNFKSDIFDYLLDGKFEKISKIWECSKNEVGKSSCKEKSEEVLETTEQIQEDSSNTAGEKNTVPQSVISSDPTISDVPVVPADNDSNVVESQSVPDGAVTVVVNDDTSVPEIKTPVDNEENKNVVVSVIESKDKKQEKTTNSSDLTSKLSLDSSGGTTDIKNVGTDTKTEENKSNEGSSDTKETKRVETISSDGQSSITTITTPDGNTITLKKKKVNKKGGNLFSDFLNLMNGWKSKATTYTTWDDKTGSDVTNILYDVQSKIDDIFKKYSNAIANTYKKMMEILLSISAELSAEAKLVVAESFANIAEFGNPIGEIITTDKAGSGSSICNGKLVTGANSVFGWIMPTCKTAEKLVTDGMKKIQDSFNAIIPKLNELQNQTRLALSDTFGRSGKGKDDRNQNFFDVKKTVSIIKTIANPLNL